MAPRGLCISLNDAGVATIPQNRCRATSTKKRKRREAHTYVQDAARLKRTRRKSRPSACSQWRVDLSLKRPRSNPDKADAARIREIEFSSSSCGDPVLEWWRPGGSGLAITDQGSQAYLSLAAKIPWRESRKDRMSRSR
jgi:hypothetical protein